jgi:hypothetical protein
MKLFKLALAAAALSSLAACGGGDTEDRLDVADPKVRFVDVARLSADVTLYRNDVGQSDANNVGYKYGSHYFDVSPGDATWSIRPASATSTQLAAVSFDADRGDRNTIVAVTSDAGVDAVLIRDPYNKSLTSDKARIRILNAAVNAQAIDLYITQPGADISNSVPDFPNVQFKQSSPSSGNDSIEYPSGSYQLRVTTAGTKTVLFTVIVNVADNADWLLVPIPTADSGDPVSGDIKLLLVEGNNDNTVTSEITSSP